MLRSNEKKGWKIMPMYDLVSLGELLIDFTPLGVSANGNPIFERNPGGGPANMACAAAKLGAKVAFAGKVGNDMFGTALKKFLGEQGVDTQALLLSDHHKTTLAFVQLDENGDRSFSFYRKNGADTMIEFSELPASVLDTKYFFCSSVLMAEGTSRKASFDALEAARAHGNTVVFDPNLRFNLWESWEELKACVLRAIFHADIAKLAEDELTFLYETEDIDVAAKRCMDSCPHCKALLVTRGAKGCIAFVNGKRYEQGAYPIKAVDTTGAGDSFTGGFVAALLQTGKAIEDCTEEEVRYLLRYANAVGSLTASRKGSICALPTPEEVEKALKEQW